LLTNIFQEWRTVKKTIGISISISLWLNDTETNTFYLLRFKIRDGLIEVFFKSIRYRGWLLFCPRYWVYYLSRSVQYDPNGENKKLA
jgi:hypothetical protein